MVKKIIVSTALAVMLGSSFSGCVSTGGPDAKTAQGNTYFEYVKERPSVEPVAINIKMNGIDEINEKLVLLSKAYKSSILLTEMVFQNEEVEKLLKSNEQKIAELEEQIKSLSQKEQEVALEGFMDYLETTPEFEAAKKVVRDKGSAIKKEVQAMVTDELRNYIIKKLGMQAVMGSMGGSSMGFMEKGMAMAELRKVPDALSQVTYSVKGLGMITERKMTDVVYSGQDATMYLQNSLEKSLASNFTEDEALDSTQAAKSSAPSNPKS